MFLQRIRALCEIRALECFWLCCLVDIAAGRRSGFSSLGTSTRCQHTRALYNSQYLVVLRMHESACIGYSTSEVVCSRWKEHE